MEKGMQLIDGNGKFNVEGLQDLMTTTEFAQCGLSYSVVAIIGPQSSGKSTLMNHVFGTDFKMLNANKGRGQTTKGIWIAKSSEIEPFTIAMDLEGTDSSARGEDNTAFEKQSTLFALAIADTVLVNMWCKDIGLEHAACRPLLKLVFQVMKRLFQPRKRTLLFVIRDHTRTPLEFLETALRKDIEKIWATVAEPETHSSAALSDYFNVEITALSSYEFEEDKFKDQVAHLKQRFFNSNSPRDLAADRLEVEPASGFSVCAEKIWKTIKDNKDLHVPDRKVMAASVRYDKEVIYFYQDVRNAKRKQLELNALEVVRDAYVTMLEHLSSNTRKTFKTELEQLLNEGEGFVASARSCARSCLHAFDQGWEDAAIRQSEWNASNGREILTCDMLSEIMAICEEQLADVLADEVQSLFEAGETDTWLSVRNVLESKTENAVSEFSDAVVGFKVHRSAIDTKLEQLRESARNVVKRKAKEAAAAERVLTRMKDRFKQVFNRDETSKSRFWFREKNIDEIERNALSASLKILSTMAAMRLDKLTDQIEHLLFSSLMDESGDIPSSQRTGATPDPLASNTWEEESNTKQVSPNDTLLTPVECKSLWMEFKEDMKYKMNQARSDQEALRNAKRVIKIVVGVAGAAAITAVGVPTAMKIAARPEVAAVLKAVTTWSLAVLKYIGMDVLETLKYLGMDVLEMLKDAVRSLHPHIVAIIIALVTQQSDWRQQY
ncbi:hypothetical protein POTOM_050830 [Populus tomentosa]|uniref:GB1/RHD3-type G domain-containing protein n=1 Tax=Populus tomentosa TaxID=118781 RepID=A0A8X7YB42_POPTO|nr:hypothetical protein POTOM_050830 [Populus tomentosa]